MNKLLYSTSFIQLVKYVLIGILGLIVDFGVYTVLTHFTINVEIANIISSTCGIINNFFWNSYTNFKVHDRLILRFISYFLEEKIITIFITFYFFIFAPTMGFPHLIVKIIATFVATLIQFIINKIITFRKSKNKI